METARAQAAAEAEARAAVREEKARAEMTALAAKVRYTCSRSAHVWDSKTLPSSMFVVFFPTWFTCCPCSLSHIFLASHSCSLLPFMFFFFLRYMPVYFSPGLSAVSVLVH